jgi:urease accessory protein
MPKKLFAMVWLIFFPTLAFAHPGHADASFAQAFAHPFTGIDHLLMMLGVGVWAGRTGGNARWQLPLSFLAAMVVGWVLGAQGFVIAGVESGIAAGLIALGMLFIAQAKLSRVQQLAITAGFALLHGMAHGAELGSALPWLSAAGFVSAGALLHASGIALTELLPKDRTTIYRTLGAALTLIGGSLLVAA